MVVGDGAFRRQLAHGGGAHMMGLVPCEDETGESLFLLLSAM